MGLLSLGAIGTGIAVIAAAALAGAWVGGQKPQSLRYFKDDAYHFQTLRALNDIRADGADTGEVLETVRSIRSGDAQSWYAGWEATGDRILDKASGLKDPVSRGQSYLRAHNYLRTAEFFLPSEDPKRPAAFAKSTDVFYHGLDALRVPYERRTVAYEGKTLATTFYPGPEGAESKPLIVFCGGYDSTLEELYFMLVRGAHDRGYSVLTFEGPGQGAALRIGQMTFIPQWERPTRAVLDDFLARHAKPTKLVLVGMSMGGYLAPRAAAFDDRIDGVVAFDVLYDFGEVTDRAIPSFAFWLRDHGMQPVLRALVAFKARMDPGFAWAMANGMWVMGTGDEMATADALRAYTLAPVAKNIKSDVLVLAGEEDHFIPATQAHDFAGQLTNARSVTTIMYDRASGGAEHCQLGAQALWHADFFDWMRAKFASAESIPAP